MRLLITLLLAHCFSCIVLKKFADELEVEKGNALNFNSTASMLYRKSDRGPFYYQNFTNFQQRKLLSYSDKPFDANPIKGEHAHKMNTRLHEKDQEDFLMDTNDNVTKIQNELWDEWGNWSTCSVTCGSGRQVRWRHCSAEHCMKGLKKAQIKACRLKDCDKNILHWLGIKSTA